MTQTLATSRSPGSPAPGSTPTPAPGEPPPERPRRRSWLLAFWAAAFVAFLAPSPGRMTFETKLAVALAPWRFLVDLGDLWHDRAGFGGLADQYIGYAFPMLPYYALADLAHLPVWIAERLWLSLVVTTAFWGALRLAERLRVGSPPSRLLGAAAYALWPAFTIVIGSTSAAALPGAVLPWVLLPLADGRRTARLAAARSALLIPFMGGVNAASTLAALLPALLYVLTRTGSRRWRLLAWWLPGVVLATAWWSIPLLLLGLHGENFMPYIEQADTTTATMSATELLRGAGNWVAYLNFGEPWLPAGWTLVAGAFTVLGTALVAALGLAGLARRDLPERRWLLLTVLAVVAVALAGYGGALGGPLHEQVRAWLDGPLQPFRNVYKFAPGLALALAYGLAHLTGAAYGPRERRPVRGGRWYVPLIVAFLLLPALALPYLNGTVLQSGAFTRLPAHWQRTADWLKEHSPDDRALVVPATAHGLYTWGSPIDQPLDVLAESRWAQRDFVPFGTKGSRRTMDAVEQALMTGSEVPGLRGFLNRAGLHHVVVRNDLDPDQIGYVPPQTVRRTLDASGYRKVASFGPLTTSGRIAADTPVQVQGLYPRQRAVEIYEPVGTPRPGPVTVKAAADIAQLSGGPEALLQFAADPGLRDRPSVLTGDAHPGVDTPALQLTGDGLRRADTRFGLVNTNTSYTYTAGERNGPDSVQDPGRPPRQILPAQGIEHQTTAVLRGARAVTASSSGSWLFHLPQYDPVHAFDGDPATAWAEGSAGEPVGQWLRIAFRRPVDVPATLSLTPLPGDGLRAAPTAVRVTTDRGSAVSQLRTDGRRQPVKAPPGRAKWLKVTLVGAEQPRPGASGAGISEVTIPGVRVTRFLRLPADSTYPDAPATTYALHRGSDPGGLAPGAAETGLHRQFRTGADGSYRVSAQALAVPGRALDALLTKAAPEQRRRITATADSTSTTGQSLSPRNLVDGDLTTAWIAGDTPTVHLRWPGKKKIDTIVLGAAGGISARPEQILINSPYGAATAGVDENGTARFDPITTDRLDITVSRVAPLTLHNPVAGQPLQLPVGLSEIYLPALKKYRTPPPKESARFSLPCGRGPDLTIDGVPYATKSSGLVRDLVQRRPVKVELCRAEGGRVALPAGRHRVEAGDRGPLALTDVTLRRGTAAPTAVAPRRVIAGADWSGDSRDAYVGPGRGVYLQTYENANEGWRATLDGRPLTPLRVDGWQQAFLIPPGGGGTVHLYYAPAAQYRMGLILGAVGVLLVAACALVRQRKRVGEAPVPVVPPAPSWVLGVVVLTAVLALATGPYAAAVPVLALLARVRPGVLAPLAFLSMAAAGVVASFGAGFPPALGRGPFSAPAQALALFALAAALVTVPPGRLWPASWRLRRKRRAPEEGPAEEGAAKEGAAEEGAPAQEPAPTRPLPADEGSPPGSEDDTAVLPPVPGEEPPPETKTPPTEEPTPRPKKETPPTEETPPPEERTPPPEEEGPPRQEETQRPPLPRRKKRDSEPPDSAPREEKDGKEPGP
ncbi:alpha-(1-_3)-arabinofuranosyltransferase domain-containing protein [Streptomyces purpurogeneiscleroticus]|uniref:alpha-(1->3)-arabinofuranosyltransferase domain-containing protein n=1 Tax=Streptomyces purpurogeneiscleroticus TaxID=68259 RepID=UPI001CBC0C98|nr:alpha-(1->3)-arabinofuranosyltransferase family protein [Streptomyces purpurogeneiscleroticus]MBZ4017989.1 coagulation factor 5/8 type domain-containing protein [Streptomyces purpurogeneiscleroticus]